MSYTGSEVYLSLVDPRSAPYRADVKQLGVEALCTNRDLPLHMPVGIGGSDFTMERTAPCTSIRCVGSPTSPKPSHAEGEFAWRVINHMSLNYLSLNDTGGGEGVSALRDILRLYSDTSDMQTRRQIDGLKSMNSRPITRRITSSRSIAFARGLEITVTLEESLFEGTGVFLLPSLGPCCGSSIQSANIPLLLYWARIENRIVAETACRSDPHRPEGLPHLPILEG